MAYGIPFASEDGARQVIMRGISYLRTLRHAYERACGSLFRHLKSFQATKQIPWAKPALGMTSWRIGLGGLGTWKVRTSNVGMRSSCAHIHLAAMIMTVLLILVVSVLPAASLQTTPPVRSAKLTRSTKLTRSAKLLRSTNPKMAEAFAKYVRETDERNNSELRRAANLLWLDELSDSARQKAYVDLRNGAVQLQQQKAPGSGGENSCPDCMIHHWEGVVFIPGARLDDVLRVLQDYNRHAEYYAPDVAASRIEARDGDHFRVFLRFRRQKVITVVLNTEHEITYVRDSASQAHSRSSATHI